jgi:signal transduction histidine kinase
MAIGVFFPLALLAAAGLYWGRALDDRLLSARLAAAKAVAAHFDFELTGDLEELQRLAAVVGSPLQEGELASVRRTVRDVHHEFGHRDLIFILDGNGNPVAVEPPGEVPEAVRAASSFVKEALASGRPTITGAIHGGRGATICELVPIRGWSGAVVGVTGAAFRPERRDFERMLDHIPRGETGSVDLVDGNGVVIASTARGRAGGKAADVRPNEHLTFAALESAPWGVAVRLSAAEALPNEGTLPWYVVLSLLAGQFLLAGAFAWGAAKSVTRPVAVLTHHAERIAAGELATSIPDLGKDEVGRLGRSLEGMRQNLRLLIGQVAEANAGLEQRIDARTKELNEANARLREREEARSQLLRMVITAQEDERKRIARELHDQTSQDLAALVIGLDALHEAVLNGRAPRVDEVKVVAVRALDEVHRLILDLRPSVLDDLGLVSAVRWYADRHLGSRGIAVRCEFGHVRRPAPEVETALFRICQEAVSNIARHAQANAVLVQVGMDGGELVVDIEDDGIGFDPEAVGRREGRRSWGLMGIRERAQILGGFARIESSAGRGTRVEVRIRVPRDPAAREGASEATNS